VKLSYDVRLSHPQYYVDDVECMRGCPVCADARGYIIAISQGDLAEGYRIARGPNRFLRFAAKSAVRPAK